MDGMRKIPDNVPNRGVPRADLHKPLTIGARSLRRRLSRASAHHNNAMLRRFLDTFGFDYEFASATDYYKSGRFDAMLLRAAERYDAIMAVMLPTLGEERQATYSPVPADLAEDRPRALRADEGRGRRGRHHHLRRRGRHARPRCRSPAAT